MKIKPEMKMIKRCFLSKSLLKGQMVLALGLLLLSVNVMGQTDSTQTKTDSLALRLSKTDSLSNQDAIYNRPFINVYKNALAIGGYLEANSNYFVTDGVTDGFSMEFRRFNIFMYASVHRRIKFLSELEFEHGTKEINLETALVDFEIHPAFTLRGGIILPPIGSFNFNHDSPRWDVIDRPLVSTQIIPATLSEVGVGFYGKLYRRGFQFAYDFYITNGLGAGVIQNAEGRTSLQAGKSPDMFAFDPNGEPMFSAKVAAKVRKIGELGLSYYGGTYNNFRAGGQKVDKRYNLSVAAVDFATEIYKLNVQGEFAFVFLQRPETAGEMFGKRQWGGFVDLVYPLYSWTAIRKPLFKTEKIKRTNPHLQDRNAVLGVVFRAEAVDFNWGQFASTAESIGQETFALVGGLSLRIAYNTVVRFNFRYHWTYDLLGNEPSRMAGFQGGLASYF